MAKSSEKPKILYQLHFEEFFTILPKNLVRLFFTTPLLFPPSIEGGKKNMDWRFCHTTMNCGENTNQMLS